MVTLALDVDRSEVVEGGSMVASVVKESSGKLERPITLSLFTVEGTALGTYTDVIADVIVYSYILEFRVIFVNNIYLQI